jgi:hypothetical protein
MKILMILLLVSQAHAMTAQESYRRYQKAIEKQKITYDQMLVTNTKLALKLIEKAIEHNSSFGECTYDYNASYDQSIPTPVNSKEIVDHFQKLGYKVTSLDKEFLDILNAHFDWCGN